MSLSVVDRFGSKLQKNPSGCWEWSGYRMVNGYGKFRVGKAMRLAHRVAYEMHVGPIPAGMVLDHLCRNRACVNPDHLEAVTQTENNDRSESISALNARKRHCKRGHPFDQTNTYVNADGRRNCRECRRMRRAGGAA